MALYAFDGTWNVDEADEIKETNVLAFCKCLPLDMRVFYLEGVGSRIGFIGKLLGGLAGVGGRFRIAQELTLFQLVLDDRKTHFLGPPEHPTEGNVSKTRTLSTSNI